MGFQKWPKKDPEEYYDFSIDWSDRLGTDTIAASIWVLPSGITTDQDQFTDTVATVWIDGGTHGVTYEVVNKITTTAGRRLERTALLPVKTL